MLVCRRLALERPIYTGNSILCEGGSGRTGEKPETDLEVRLTSGSPCDMGVAKTKKHSNVRYYVYSGMQPETVRRLFCF